jgi:hypothetical protein
MVSQVTVVVLPRACTGESLSHGSITMILQLLQGVTVVLQWCHTVVTLLLHCCYGVTARRLAACTGESLILSAACVTSNGCDVASNG